MVTSFARGMTVENRADFSSNATHMNLEPVMPSLVLTTAPTTPKVLASVPAVTMETCPVPAPSANTSRIIALFDSFPSNGTVMPTTPAIELNGGPTGRDGGPSFAARISSMGVSIVISIISIIIVVAIMSSNREEPGQTDRDELASPPQDDSGGETIPMMRFVALETPVASIKPVMMDNSMRPTVEKTRIEQGCPQSAFSTYDERKRSEQILQQLMRQQQQQEQRRQLQLQQQQVQRRQRFLQALYPLYRQKIPLTPNQQMLIQQMQQRQIRFWFTSICVERRTMLGKKRKMKDFKSETCKNPETKQAKRRKLIIPTVAIPLRKVSCRIGYMPDVFTEDTTSMSFEDAEPIADLSKRMTAPSVCEWKPSVCDVLAFQEGRVHIAGRANFSGSMAIAGVGRAFVPDVWEVFTGPVVKEYDSFN